MGSSRGSDGRLDQLSVDVMDTMEGPYKEDEESEEENEEKEEGRPSKVRRRSELVESHPPLDPADWAAIDPETKLVSFKTRILNQHLACTLCMGYFRNAYTITECLHTYCKDLSPYPIELIRHDRTLQSIVDKVVLD